MISSGMRYLILAVLVVLGGCRSATVTEERREPAKVKYIEIDTRPIPRAAMPPVWQAVTLAAIGQPPPQPIPITVKPDGSVVAPADFQGVIRVGTGEGDNPKVKMPDGAGVSSKALAWVSKTTRIPDRGAPYMLVGVFLLVAAPIAWWLGAGLRIAGALAIGGVVLIGVGYLIAEAPWIFAVAFLIGAAYVGYSIWEARQRADNAATVETVTPVIENLPTILTAVLTRLMPSASGDTLARVASEAAAAVKGEIGAKAKAKPRSEARVERAVKRAKKVTGTANVYRGK